MLPAAMIEQLRARRARPGRRCRRRRTALTVLRTNRQALALVTDRQFSHRPSRPRIVAALRQLEDEGDDLVEVLFGRCERAERLPSSPAFLHEMRLEAPSKDHAIPAGMRRRARARLVETLAGHRPLPFTGCSAL